LKRREEFRDCLKAAQRRRLLLHRGKMVLGVKNSSKKGRKGGDGDEWAYATGLARPTSRLHKRVDAIKVVCVCCDGGIKLSIHMHSS